MTRLTPFQAAERVAACDQVLAMLRDAGEPGMSTSQIGEHLPVVRAQACSGRCRAEDVGQRQHWYYLDHEGALDVYTIARRAASGVWPVMNQLLTRGLVERERRGHSVYWSLAGSRDDEHVATILDLEAALML